MNEWKEMQKRVGKYRRAHGFFTPITFDNTVSGITGADVLLGKMALIHSEVGEASEAIRHHDTIGLEMELADIIIRVMDVCDALDFDLWSAIDEKMYYNEKRPYRHGKKTTI